MQQRWQGDWSEFLSFQMSAARANSWLTLYTVDYVMFALAEAYVLKLNAVSVTQRRSEALAVRPTHILVMLMRVTSACASGESFGWYWDHLLFPTGGGPNDHLQVWHCLWQMYFLMKVWGQRVPSRGWRSINNYSLQSFWQFFQHPSSTPTAPFLSIHIVCLLDYRRRAKTFYRLSGVFLLVVLAKVSISITTAHSVLKIRDLSKP